MADITGTMLYRVLLNFTYWERVRWPWMARPCERCGASGCPAHGWQRHASPVCSAIPTHCAHPWDPLWCMLPGREPTTALSSVHRNCCKGLAQPAEGPLLLPAGLLCTFQQLPSQARPALPLAVAAASLVSCRETLAACLQARQTMLNQPTFLCKTPPTATQQGTCWQLLQIHPYMAMGGPMALLPGHGCQHCM